MQSLAAAQDKIRWRHFTEGKLALQVRQIQRYFLYTSDTSLTVNSWLKGFVSKLLEMTHAQWIFRCITKHHRTKGTIVLKATEDLLQEVERQLSMGVDNVSEDDRWMLELDMDQLLSFSLSKKQLWIQSVEAARQASTRAMQLSEGATNNWNDIIKDKKYDFLPATTQTSQDPSAPAATAPSPHKTVKETSPKQERERESVQTQKKQDQPRKPRQATKTNPKGRRRDHQRRSQSRQRLGSIRASEQGTVHWSPQEPAGNYTLARKPWMPTYHALASSPRRTR